MQNVLLCSIDFPGITVVSNNVFDIQYEVMESNSSNGVFTRIGSVRK